MVSTDSCFAVSMNEQVFTTMMSASSARGVICGATLRQQAHHDLAVDQVLGTAQADKSDFLRGSHGSARLGRVEQRYRINYRLHAIFLFYLIPARIGGRGGGPSLMALKEEDCL